MVKTVLITGANGFAGAALTERILETTDWNVITIERLATKDRLKDINYQNRLIRLFHNFIAPIPDWILSRIKDVNIIVHNGAAVQAIKSLDDPELFVQSNIIGTFNILEAARKINPDLFLFTSSAEAFGPCPEGMYFKETDKLTPSTPYSASKAAAEMLTNSYHKCFGLRSIICRTMNLYGIKRSPDTYVPSTIKNILNGKEVYIHVDPSGKPGTRQWMDIDTYVDALMFLIEKGQTGETYNVAGEEKDNMEIATTIAIILSKPLHFTKLDVNKAHPAHDLRYAIDDSKIRELGFKSTRTFEESFRFMVEWTVENKEWL